MPIIKEFRGANARVSEPAVLLMDNCPALTPLDGIVLLSRRRLKTIIFPLHRVGIFQMLDLLFFGVFKRVKRYISRDSSVPVMENRAVQMIKASEAAGAGSTVRTSFSRAGFI
jgi:hypothetical protein